MPKKIQGAIERCFILRLNLYSAYSAACSNAAYRDLQLEQSLDRQLSPKTLGLRTVFMCMTKHSVYFW